MTNPYNDLDNPQAISHISIISCTSPRPSDLIFPISKETSIPKASFFRLNSSPIYLTISPLLGIGNYIMIIKNTSAQRSLTLSIS